MIFLKDKLIKSLLNYRYEIIIKFGLKIKLNKFVEIISI